ncbi:hypothetical protein N3K66_000208 [Trichothecium roseum]|uniref:Uncharacterized protein n=1 Tax=Trichothecium roseum TaxID=47278 RepID=A0ACC0VBK2_9HYPO|nr:hypothetical protein N3K66_000208 [Trichothecium roseum]
MEGLGAGASIIAVVDLSVKIVTLCSQYSAAVSGAREDISRVSAQVAGLRTTLEHAAQLIGVVEQQQPNNAAAAGGGHRHHLATSRDLLDQVQRCRAELQKLEAKLRPSGSRKVMGKFGLRALKWPFGQREVLDIVGSLERFQDNIMRGLQIDQTNMLIGINEGIQNLSVQARKEMPRLARHEPHFVVPFTRDPNFVRRPEIQNWVQEQYSSDAADRMALVGLGGLGKSQIAIEFAYKVHNPAQDDATGTRRSVFWVHGSTKARILQSFRGIAERLELPGRDDPDADLLHLVRDWLQRQNEVAPWLMILDNADNINTFYDESDQEPIASCLPKAGHGKILITSRNDVAAERLTGSYNAIKRISAMDSDGALQVFRNKLNPDLYSTDAAAELVIALDCIPLVVNQAAAYINRRAPRATVQSYLELFRESHQKRTRLLNNDTGDLRRDESASNSVVVTWEVTFQQIRKERSTAADLLVFMSFFHAQNIPEDLLATYAKTRRAAQRKTRDEDDSESGDDDDGTEAMLEDIETLRAYSMISMSNAHSSQAVSYDIHPLVQFCTQNRLSARGTLCQWKALSMQMIKERFPTDRGRRALAHCRALLPHVEVVLDGQLPVNDSDAVAAPDENTPLGTIYARSLASLLYSVGLHMLDTGDHVRAEKYMKRCLDLRSRVLGDDHDATINTKNKLATAYSSAGHADKAEELQLQVIAAQRGKVSDDSFESNRLMLSYQHNLADIFGQQGRWAEAESLYALVLEGEKRLHGADHEDIATMTGLASAIESQGRYDEAERLQVSLLALSCRLYGEDHPDTLTAMMNLAWTQARQRRYADAELLQADVLTRAIDLLGPDHPQTLAAKVTLSTTYYKQGRYAEAEPLESSAFEARKRLFGEDHPDTLVAMHNLARTKQVMGKRDEALALLQACLVLQRSRLGPSHSDTLTSASILAQWYPEAP